MVILVPTKRTCEYFLTAILFPWRGRFGADPHTLSLSFPSWVGCSYTVEGTSGLDGWGEVEPGIMGTGTVLHRTYGLPAGEPDYFFRLSESP